MPISDYNDGLNVIAEHNGSPQYIRVSPKADTKRVCTIQIYRRTYIYRYRNY